MSGEGSIVLHFAPQVSPCAEKCVRCDHFARPSRIAPGALYVAVIEHPRQMDTAARITLCALCEFFVRDALASETATR